jgi:hypothetical protein
MGMGRVEEVEGDGLGRGSAVLIKYCQKGNAMGAVARSRQKARELTSPSFGGDEQRVLLLLGIFAVCHGGC